MAVPAKEKHKVTLLKYLGNPDNPFPNRLTQATKVLGFKYDVSLYKTFTVEELDEIEREALEMRRKRYRPEIAKVDKALIKEAKLGDTSAAKLVYERFEGWSPTKNVKLEGGEDPILIKVTDKEGV